MNPVSTIAAIVKEAEDYADVLSGSRLRAIQYYQGEMKDTPADKGRSSMVSRDVRAHIKKVLPSMMRVLLGGSAIVEFLPVGPGDEESAGQATDFVNEVIVGEAEIYTTIEDGIHDALLLRNGILRWWYEEKKCASVSTHTGLTDDALAELVGGDEVEVLEHSQTEGMAEQPDEMGQMQQIPVALHDVKIRRVMTKKKYRTAAVPRERFLIHPNAVDLDDSPIVGEKDKMRRSDLVAMGYDKELIWGLSTRDDDDETEQDARRETIEEGDDLHRANELVDYYDLYMRFDMDGDGIAELRHIVFAGALTQENMLVNDECDEVQYCDLKVMSQPHQWEGISLADDLMDLQRGKTVLLRQTLDNIYWSNNPMISAQLDALDDPDALLTPEFGRVIGIKAGYTARDAMSPIITPFVADKSFAMMEYLDREAQERTGVSDASAGLAPDALQNMTAKASAMIEQAGIGQTELMVRTVAQGLRRFFQGVLRMVIRHQDVPRTIRLRDEWVEFDPRHWNAEMDCSVNTGLGAGTRERDMAVMMQVMGLQEKMLAGFGPDNPFVKPDNVYNAVKKMIEAAGLKTVDPYFTEPDMQEVQAKLDAMKNQPSPEMAKAQAQQQADQARMQAQQQMDQARLQMDGQKAQAQLAMDREQMQAEFDLKLQQMQAEFNLKREQMAAEMQLKREQTTAELMIKGSVAQGAATTPVRMGGAVG